MTLGTRTRVRFLNRRLDEAVERRFASAPVASAAPSAAAAQRSHQNRRRPRSRCRARPRRSQPDMPEAPEPARRRELTAPRRRRTLRMSRRQRRTRPDRELRRALRHAAGSSGSAAIALALGGIFLVRYLDRAGLHRPRRAHLARRAARRRADRRRRMDAPHARSSPASPALPSAHIPSILTAAGTTVAYADDLRGLCALRLPRPGRRLHPARDRRARDARAPRCCTAPRSPGSGSSAPSSRRCWSQRTSRTTGRSTSISRSSPPPRSRWRACGCGAGSPSRRRCSACCGRCPDSAHARVAGAVGALLPRDRRLRARRRADRLRPVLRAGRRARPHRCGLVRRARRLSVRGALLLVLASHHDPAALTVFALLVAATIAIAWRTDAARSARCRPPRVLAALVFAALGRRRSTSRTWSRPAAPPAGAMPDPRAPPYGCAPRARLRLFAALFGGAGFLAQGRSEQPRDRRCCGARPACSRRSRSWSRSTIASTASTARSRLRRSRCCSPRCSRLATEMLSKREPRPGIAVGRGDLRHRRDRGARARADHCAGEGLAHRRARPDGAGHRLGRREAAAAGAALALRRSSSRW